MPGKILASREEALTITCPLCHAKPNEPCRYVDIAGGRIVGQWTKDSVRRAAALVGTPTRMPHSRRHREYHFAKLRHQRVLAYNRMVRFMREHGNIFQEDEK